MGSQAPDPDDIICIGAEFRPREQRPPIGGGGRSR